MGLIMKLVEHTWDNGVHVVRHLEEVNVDFSFDAYVNTIAPNGNSVQKHFDWLYENKIPFITSKWLIDQKPFWFKNKEDAMLFKLTWGGN